MTRGKQVAPKKREEAIALAVREGNVSEAARLIKLPRETVRDLVKDDNTFAAFRQQVLREYIVDAWQNIKAIEEAIAVKVSTQPIHKLDLKELTGAVKDLRQTVENVVNSPQFQVNIQQNFTLDSKEVQEGAEAYAKNCTTEQLKRLREILEERV